MAAPETYEEADDRGLAHFRPLQLYRAADQVALVLIDAMRGGVYGIGDLLPRERDLAARLEVSRPVVREALSILQSAGVISVSRGPNGGYAIDSVANLAAVQRRIQGETVSVLSEVLEARRLLEMWAALRCSERASDSELDSLLDTARELGEVVQRGEDVEVVRETDARFHLTMVDLARNELVLDCYRRTFDAIFHLREGYPVGHVAFDLSVRNQLHTARALRSRDANRIRKSVDTHLASLEIVYLGRRLSNVT